MFWARLAFAARQVARVEILAVLGLQLVLMAVMLLASAQVGGPVQPWEIGSKPTPELQWRIYYPMGAWLLAALLLMPAFVYIWASLNNNAFGVPLPISVWRACLRLLRAYVVMALWAIVLFVGLFLLGFLSVILAKIALGEGAGGPVWVPAIWGGLGALAINWLFLIHCFYPLGQLYQAPFSLRAARTLSRGWRWSIFGLLTLWGLAVFAAQIPFMLLMPAASFTTVQIGGSLVVTLVQMPFFIAFLALYFQASAAWTPGKRG